MIINNKLSRKAKMLLFTVFLIAVVYFINKPKKVNEFSSLIIYNESIDGEHLRGDKSSNLVIYNYNDLKRETVVKLPSMIESLSYNQNSKKLYFLGRYKTPDNGIGSFQPLVFDFKKNRIYPLFDYKEFNKIKGEMRLFDFKVNPTNSDEFVFLFYNLKSSYFRVSLYNAAAKDLHVFADSIRYKYAPELAFIGEVIFVFCQDYLNSSQLDRLYLVKMNKEKLTRISIPLKIRKIEGNENKQYFVDILYGDKIYSYNEKLNAIMFEYEFEINFDIDFDKVDLIGIINNSQKRHLIEVTKKENPLKQCYYIINNNTVELISDCKKTGQIVIN